jgi:hypothetical protein
MKVLESLLSLMALAAVSIFLGPATGFSAIITIDETKQAWAASAPVLGGYLVLCEAIPPQQGACGVSSLSDIVVFNGGAAISYFSDADTSGIPFFGDHDPADVGFGAFGPGGLAIVFAAPTTQYFDETAVFNDPTTGAALPKGTIVYTPAAGLPGFPVAAGAADTYVVKSDCSDCSCGGCTPEPLSLYLLFSGLVGITWLRGRTSGI